MEKRFMAGVYSDLHFIAELKDGKYKCLPRYSGGNGTDMTFFAEKPQARFFETLEDAIANKSKHNRRQAGIREERMLTGYYNREY